MLARVGVPLERFGDSTGELAGLSDPDYKGNGSPVSGFFGV